MKVVLMEALGIPAEELAARKKPFEAQGVVFTDSSIAALTLLSPAARSSSASRCPARKSAVLPIGCISNRSVLRIVNRPMDSPLFTALY